MMINNISNKPNAVGQRIARAALTICLFFTGLSIICGIAPAYGQSAPYAKYVILMIADGLGQTKIDAANMYTGSVPFYQTDPLWIKHWMTTYPYGCDYNTALAWGNFTYVTGCVTDSAAAASALYAGIKTQNSRISVSFNAVDRLFTIGEAAKTFGAGVGSISTVPVTDATAGAMVAHNDSRANYYAIADEGFFGDPNTTGPPSWLYYGGGHGPTFPVADVLIGDGRDSFVSTEVKVKLRDEKGLLGNPARDTSKHYLVERQAGLDAGTALMQAALDPYVTKLSGLYDQVYRNADGSGYDPENPTLSESTEAALTVLSKNPNGFVLMIEGGAVDWAGHANNMDYSVGEMIDFNDAVQTVINWIDNTSNDSNWSNTLLIVTGDHETGYLTAGPGRFPNQPFGPVTSGTLSLEKIYSGSSGRRASWNDWHNFGTIDNDETIYWAWNTGGHANVLIPLFTRGVGSGLFENCIAGSDQVRGEYIDNTDVARVMGSAMAGVTTKGSLAIIPGQSLQGNPVNLTSIVTETNAADTVYTVSEGAGCPAQSNKSVINRRASWKYDIENTGSTWMNTGFNDAAWSSGSGVFGTETSSASYGYSITTPISNTKKSMFFRNKFTVCDPSAVTALTLNALFDDGMAVYINGTQVYSQGVNGNPPQFDGSAVEHEATSYEAKSLSSVISLNALRDLLVTGENVIAVGVYNIIYPPDPPYISSDIVWDGELVISNSGSTGILFTGSSTQAQAVNTAGWTMGGKNIKVSGSDATCLTPLADANDTFNFAPCNATGSLSIIPGQTLSGNPVDLTSIVSADNTTNLLYTLTEGPGCPEQANQSIIAKRDAWKFDIENTGSSWMNTGYNDIGWPTGSGVFGTEPSAASYGYSIATPVSNTYNSMFFRKTFNVCDPSEITALTLNSLYDDGMVVYINGTKVYSAGVTGDPPPYTSATFEHEAVTYETKDLTSIIGLNALRSVLVPGGNIIAVGVYNLIYPAVPPDPPYISSDIVWDGELIMSQNSSVMTLFTGGAAEAQAVNTTGWTEETKDLQVSGNDATCFSPLTDATGEFTFLQLVNYYCDSDGDTYISEVISGTCTGAGCAPSGCQTNAGADCDDSHSAINPAASETCDNVDDNCNGFTDENLTRPTTCGMGICSVNTGVETCGAGVWGNNTCNPYEGAVAEGPPGDQTCMDNLDNDCDGAADIGDIDCHVAFEQNCFDEIDDDIDGLADCADPDCTGATNGACSTGQPGICSTGILTCQSGASGCVADNIPQAEVCDGMDNNCDGALDENLTRPTTCGVGICAGNTGLETCGAGVWENNTCDPYEGAQMEGPPGDPSCSDSLDNDCDGETDNAHVGCHVDHETNCFNGIDDDANGMTDCEDGYCVGAANGACTTGQPGICSTGILICQTGASVCLADNMPAAEVCDGLDNNCDAGVDEGCDDDGDGYCDNTMTVSDAPVSVCLMSVNGPGDDCNDNDPNISPGGPPVRIAGTLPEYFMSIQQAYSSPASNKILQTKGAVLQENLLFNMNNTVTFEAGYDCSFLNINDKTTVNGSITISSGLVTIGSGTLELK